MKQQGFTTVELVITLFIAAAFLIAGYQLFNAVVADSGDSRAMTRASNVAYDYVRRYSPAAVNPCFASNPVTDAPITIDGVTNPRISVTITCPVNNNGASKVEATVAYDNPQKIVRHSTYTDGKQIPSDAIVTEGLVGWWRLNGNAKDSAGVNDGVAIGAQSTTGQNGQAASAYAFDGNDRIALPDAAGLSGNPRYTLMGWESITYANDNNIHGILGWGNWGVTNNSLAIRLDTTAGAINYWWGNDVLANNRPTVYNGAWHHIVATYDGTTRRIYTDGILRNSDNPTGLNAQAINVNIGSTGQGNEMMIGKIDDVRIYNRAITQEEVTAIYNGGAK